MTVRLLAQTLVRCGMCADLRTEHATTSQVSTASGALTDASDRLQTRRRSRRIADATRRYRLWDRISLGVVFRRTVQCCGWRGICDAMGWSGYQDVYVLVTLQGDCQLTIQGTGIGPRFPKSEIFCRSGLLADICHRQSGLESSRRIAADAF